MKRHFFVLVVAVLFISCTTIKNKDYDSSMDGMWELVEFGTKDKITKYPLVKKGKKYHDFHYLKGNGKAWFVRKYVDLKTGKTEFYSHRKSDFKYRVEGDIIIFGKGPAATIVRQGNKVIWKYPDGKYEININRKSEINVWKIKRY